MTQTDWRPRVQGVIPVIPQEIDDFEEQVRRFRAGEWDPDRFMAYRLVRGVYGQRQPDAQMVRVKVPFGGLTAEQLEALGEVARRFAPLHKGHVTTRENIQFHHVKLEDAPELMRLIGDVGLTTREACGNTVRNVTGCPMAGVCADEPFDVTPYAAAYVRHFVRHPKTQAMPRKFKTAFSGCPRDCAITPIHDLGFIPRIVDGRKGFKIVVGGGTSIMPRLAETLYEFVPVEEYLKVAEAVIRIFDRTDELRKNKMKARLKFYINRIGTDAFRAEVEEELKKPWAREGSFDPTPLLWLEDEAALAPPIGAGDDGAPDAPERYHRWLETNVEPQKQEGYFAATVKLPQGDIKAEQFFSLAELSRRYAAGRVRVTQEQNLVIRWVPRDRLYGLWQGLEEIGLGEPGAHHITDIVSCPGTDSCKLGITSSMGLGRAMVETLAELAQADPTIKDMRVKVSGCPNGCGQHHIADIGFHGAATKAPGGQVPAYELFLGGTYRGREVNFGLRVRTKVPAKRVPEALRRILGFYRENRQDGETFRAFVERVGPKTFEPLLADLSKVGELGRDTLPIYMDWERTVKYQLERGEGECSV